LSAEQQREIWDRLARGERSHSIGPAVGCHEFTVRQLAARTGGIRPRERTRSSRCMSLEKREEISRGLAQHESMCSIAVRLGRAPSTISREVIRNGRPANYRALAADRRAWDQAQRPKPATCPKLRHIVERKLERRWSLRQISRWLAKTFPEDPELAVSHETIYQSLYVQGRGALRKELHQALRSGRAMRRPKVASPMKRRSHIPDMVLISERPAEVRAVPGHWEGDLIEGSKSTRIGTLAERSTRFVLLLKLNNGTADEVCRATTNRVARERNDRPRETLGWDSPLERLREVVASTP
jgi:IS30 family transposase